MPRLRRCAFPPKTVSVSAKALLRRATSGHTSDLQCPRPKRTHFPAWATLPLARRNHGAFATAPAYPIAAFCVEANAGRPRPYVRVR
jgi:hypothetical protein